MMMLNISIRCSKNYDHNIHFCDYSLIKCLHGVFKLSRRNIAACLIGDEMIINISTNTQWKNLHF